MLRKSLAPLVGVLLAVPTAYAETSGSTFTDPVFNFSVEVPALGDPASAPTVTRVIVSGPLIDGFATNCNVQVQYARMDHAEFIDLSLQQFGAAGIRVLEQKPEKVSGLEATRFEYAGQMGGRDLHFLALAVTDADRVVMLTCTTLEKRFEAERQVLLGVLESFRVQSAG
jgi:hypothetical protein